MLLVTRGCGNAISARLYSSFVNALLLLLLLLLQNSIDNHNGRTLTALATEIKTLMNNTVCCSADGVTHIPRRVAYLLPCCLPMLYIFFNWLMVEAEYETSPVFMMLSFYGITNAQYETGLGPLCDVFRRSLVVFFSVQLSSFTYQH